MRRQTVKNHIDKKITTNISDFGYDEMRQHLKDTCEKFYKMLPPDYNVFAVNIDEIPDTRTRMVAMYVYYTETRIFDLYKIENKNVLNLNPLKNFKLLLFKERLEGKSI